MAKQLNYKQIEVALEKHEEFSHGKSMSAEWDGYEYVVYSYNTVIARYHNINGWELNEKKYSVTTSKQQSIVRRVAAKQPPSEIA